MKWSALFSLLLASSCVAQTAPHIVHPGGTLQITAKIAESVRWMVVTATSDDCPNIESSETHYAKPGSKSVVITFNIPEDSGDCTYEASDYTFEGDVFDVDREYLSNDSNNHKPDSNDRSGDSTVIVETAEYTSGSSSFEKQTFQVVTKK